MGSIELDMIVVYKVIVGNSEKTLCFTHALNYASRGLEIKVETDSSMDVQFHTTSSFCIDCKEGVTKKGLK